MGRVRDVRGAKCPSSSSPAETNYSLLSPFLGRSRNKVFIVFLRVSHPPETLIVKVFPYINGSRCWCVLNCQSTYSVFYRQGNSRSLFYKNQLPPHLLSIFSPPIPIGLLSMERVRVVRRKSEKPITFTSIRVTLH
jgi:hypothetical protein